MRNKLKKFLQLFIIFVSCNTALYADYSLSDNSSDDYYNMGYVIDYYGVISSDLDNNMSTMISDLYFKQLSEIPNFTIYDKRILPINKVPSDNDILNSDNFIFYTKIVKNKNKANWTSSYILINKNNKETPNQAFSKEKTYDSFYKILMESKEDLENSVKSLIVQKIKDDTSTTDHSNSSSIYMNKPFEKVTNTNNSSTPENKKIPIKSIEMLSGTWTGEESIDKIVILRGGRGFIIFENGASMNINVTVNEINGNQKVIIKQKGNSNASFYPNLPRKIALEAAISAPPMEWNMTLLDNMILEGTRTTLLQDAETFTVSKVPVSWKKIN